MKDLFDRVESKLIQEGVDVEANNFRKVAAVLMRIHSLELDDLTPESLELILSEEWGKEE